MDQQNNPLFLDSEPQNLFKSFLETYNKLKSSEFLQKRNEFDRKYSVSDALTLVRQDLGMAMVENLAIPSLISSSFQILQTIIDQLADKEYGSGEVHGLPEVWKSLIHKISIERRSIITQEEGPSKASHESELTALEIHAGHENEGEENSANIANSTPNNLTDGPNPILSPVIQHSEVDERHNVTHTNDGSFVIDNMPYSPRAPEEPNKLGFAVFAAIIELVSTLSNFALSNSQQANDSKPLIYSVLFSSTFAFLLSSTALLLHGKRPATANKMQKVAFFFCAFGFLGIVGMHFPPTIMWWFTTSAFVAFLLLFTIATFV